MKNGEFPGMHPASAMDYLPVAQLREVQFARLKETVRRAYENVALFRKRMDERRLKPSDLRRIEDVVKLPFMVKTDLRDNYPFGLFACPMREIVRFHASSGTTGKPIVVGYTQEDLDVILAPMAMNGEEALGSMGSDTPIALLSTRPRLLFDYFTELFAQVKLIAAINNNDPELVRAWLHKFDAIVNFGFLGQANTYAYRHRKVSLASVLDHRFGRMRDQVHSWQAAIDEDAMVFTTHPMTAPKVTEDWSDDDSPGYWTGSASMPRSAQFRRTAVHIYQPAWDEATDATLWSVFPYRQFTHAFVPQDRFDEVRQVGNWTIAAKDGGYIALWSWRTPVFKANDPGVPARTFTKPYDLVADGGPDNVWIVEVGNDEQDGDLDAFVASLTAGDPVVDRSPDGFDVAWTSPSCGAVQFSSAGAFTVAGKEQPLGDHPRHEGPWGIIEHESAQHELSNSANTWKLDFDAATRTVS